MHFQYRVAWMRYHWYGFPDVISIEEDLEDMESVYPVIEQAVREAGKHFVLSREQEGQNLKEDILSKLEYLEQTVAFVDERSRRC